MSPLDLINLSMLVILTGITLLTVPKVHGNVLLIGAYAGMAVLLLMYRRVRVPWFDFPRRFRQVYPLLYIALIFDSLAKVIPVAHDWRADDLLVAIDRRMLGVDATVFLENYVSRPAVEVLSYAYMLYFVLPFVLIWMLWRAGKLREISHWACLITIALYTNYILYFLFPAVGPRFHLTHLVPLRGMGLSNHIMNCLDVLESNKLDVFPSAHVNAALVTLYGFVRFCRRWVVPATVVALGIALATVYLRYHYVIDVAAGAALA
ncbi:MAG TPA: phosphatase PAP2 family protein, partial [Planctomycetota bacterium]|nr:phosphatase PAP2 family protein [Planctomycetota bacterium]